MIDNYEKIRVPDENKKNDFFVEVNFDKKDKCKVLRVTFPDGKQAFVKKEYLNAILFAIGNDEEQRQMIPTTVQQVRWYETVVSVKAKKDIHKGDNITFPIKISIPSPQEERLSKSIARL